MTTLLWSNRNSGTVQRGRNMNVASPGQLSGPSAGPSQASRGCRSPSCSPLADRGRRKIKAIRHSEYMIRRPKSPVGGTWAERLVLSVRESRSSFWPFGSASTGNAAFATMRCSIFAPRGGDIVGERRSRCSHLTGIFVAAAARLLVAANEARILPREQKHP